MDTPERIELDETIKSWPETEKLYAQIIFEQRSRFASVSAMTVGLEGIAASKRQNPQLPPVEEIYSRTGETETNLLKRIREKFGISEARAQEIESIIKKINHAES